MKITEYKVLGKLPDPFVFEDGSRVKSISDWERRRVELYRNAVLLQYGETVPAPEFLEVRELCAHFPAGGLNSYRIVTGRREKPISFLMYVHLPKDFEKGRKYPAVFDGDMCYPCTHDMDNIRLFTDYGIMFVKFNRDELAPDDTFIRPREEGLHGQFYDCYTETDTSLLQAWAWGYSRCVDAMEALGYLDPEHIIFTGLSRGAKTALLAGVLDERAWLVNPEATCAGGAGCYRVHMSAIGESGLEERSETLKDIWQSFPFWFGKDLGRFADCEEKLPFDSHELKALLAPRIFFDSQSADDIWSNPIGAYQTDIAAREVWKLYGSEEKVYWYWRRGKHAHTKEDFGMLSNLVRHYLEGIELDSRFRAIPFEVPEPIHDYRCPEIGG